MSWAKYLAISILNITGEKICIDINLLLQFLNLLYLPTIYRLPFKTKCKVLRV